MLFSPGNRESVFIFLWMQINTIKSIQSPQSEPQRTIVTSYSIVSIARDGYWLWAFPFKPKFIWCGLPAKTYCNWVQMGELDRVYSWFWLLRVLEFEEGDNNLESSPYWRNIEFTFRYTKGFCDFFSPFFIHNGITMFIYKSLKRSPLSNQEKELLGCT